MLGNDVKAFCRLGNDPVNLVQNLDVEITRISRRVSHYLGFSLLVPKSNENVIELL